MNLSPLNTTKQRLLQKPIVPIEMSFVFRFTYSLSTFHIPHAFLWGKKRFISHEIGFYEFVLLLLLLPIAYGNANDDVNIVWRHFEKPPENFTCFKTWIFKQWNSKRRRGKMPYYCKSIIGLTYRKCLENFFFSFLSFLPYRIYRMYACVCHAILTICAFLCRIVMISTALCRRGCHCKWHHILTIDHVIFQTVIFTQTRHFHAITLVYRRKWHSMCVTIDTLK